MSDLILGALVAALILFCGWVWLSTPTVAKSWSTKECVANCQYLDQPHYTEWRP